MGEKLKKLNLGCGKDIKKSNEKENWINLDSTKLEGVDVKHDIEKFPWPFKDNTFDEIFASHVLEHTSDLVKVMKEIRRVSKNNAIVKIKVPMFPSIHSVTDPTHKRFFTYFTFDYFSDKAYLGYYTEPGFEVLRKRINFSWNRHLKFMNSFVNAFPVFYSRFISSFLPSNELYAELRVKKS